MGRIYHVYHVLGALPAYFYIKYGSTDLIIMIDVDKTEHDILQVTFNACSSNNGDIPTFIFCRACRLPVLRWESKSILRTLLLQPWLSWVTYNRLMYT